MDRIWVLAMLTVCAPCSAAPVSLREHIHRIRVCTQATFRTISISGAVTRESHGRHRKSNSLCSRSTGHTTNDWLTAPGIGARQFDFVGLAVADRLQQQQIGMRAFMRR